LFGIGKLLSNLYIYYYMTLRLIVKLRVNFQFYIKAASNIFRKTGFQANKKITGQQDAKLYKSAKIFINLTCQKYFTGWIRFSPFSVGLLLKSSGKTKAAVWLKIFTTEAYTDLLSMNPFRWPKG